MPIKLIIGLRNPSPTYQHTRHNAGGWFVETLAHRNKALFKPDNKFHAEIANLEIEHVSCKALLPLTYMNHSGQAVRAACQFN